MISGSSSAVEHDLAKVGVAGSNPVFRSTKKKPPSGGEDATERLLFY